MPVYAATIFLSAFLLFQVQPLIAKIILPWFGGSAAVWTASLLFFQLVLLAGYAYAHFSVRFLKSRAQVIFHVALLLGSFLLLPVLPSPAWRPTGPGDPTFRILGVLAATVGLPYFLLSSTTPLLQAWYVRNTGSGIPYRLFALSNFGSLLALVSFPFLVEPMLASRQQAYWWSAAYVAFALMCAFTAWVSHNAPAASAAPLADEAAIAGGPGSIETATASGAPGFLRLTLWVALAACASVLLIAVTNHMSQNIAPIPLLWVLPLAIYLLTFIVCFESERFYRRWLFIPLLFPALGGMAYMIYAAEWNLSIKWAIPGFAAGLFVCCIVCHGELARRRPAPRQLTLFYLMISLGGALGGVFVALIAPRIFTTYFELELGLIACGLLAFIAAWDASLPKLGAWPLRIAIVIGVCALAGFVAHQENVQRRAVVLRVRNFYGPLEIREDPPAVRYAQRVLFHGTINHGSQLLNPARRYVGTSYYGTNSGVGRAINAIQARGPMRLGIVGLGAGVLSTYGRKGDYVRVYEINPLIQSIAQNWFTFYPHSPADKQILLGDARLTLERQEPQNFDLIVVDAFSSDAIPVHLLTREAVGLYWRHLKPDGILALHISNRYLNLEPVCLGDARAYGKIALTVDDYPAEATYVQASRWVLMTSSAAWFEAASFKGAALRPADGSSEFRPWTDDYSNIYQILSLK